MEFSVLWCLNVHLAVHLVLWLEKCRGLWLCMVGTLNASGEGLDDALVSFPGENNV